MKAREFFQPDGIRKHVMRRGEIITHVEIPEDAAEVRAGYEKLRLRDSFDYPVLGVAGALRKRGDLVGGLEVVVNAVSWTPLRFPEVTEAVRGDRLTEGRIAEIAEAIADRCQPVKNAYLSPPYRKQMIDVLVRRVLGSLLQG